MWLHHSRPNLPPKFATSSSTSLPTLTTPSISNSLCALPSPNNAGYSDSSNPWSWAIFGPCSYSAGCSNCSETPPPLPVAPSSMSSFYSASLPTCIWYSPPLATRRASTRLLLWLTGSSMQHPLPWPLSCRHCLPVRKFLD